VTVRVAVPEIPATMAEMVVVPTATAVAKPLLFIEATDVLDEFQATSEVISLDDPSENVPVTAKG
jgi:hypothetical protein